jgi:UPF0176 protein
VKGSVLLADEGINGTLAGPPAGMAAVLRWLRGLAGLEALRHKASFADAMPFHRLKVEIKPEIVTMGQPNIDPLTEVGHYVAAKDWNALIADPNTILIDTRNDYEVSIGTFKNAINPKTASFRDFPDWFRANRAALLDGAQAPKVAMFCTGGIRCEKSTAFLKSEGIDEVYHLDGGILKYLETVPEPESLWEGECFVFDQRVSVGHGLSLGRYGQCHACRIPLSQEDQASEHYVPGVSCPACYDHRDEAQKAGYAERQRQTALAQARGEAHVGAVISAEKKAG